MSVTSPEVLVKIGGSDIEKGLGASIGRVEVQLCLADASRAVIELTEVYDRENSGIMTAISGGLEPGDLVEIRMGYMDGKSQVFSGYLDTMELTGSGEEAYVLKLTAWDVVHLMKENQQYRIFTEKNISEVVSGVLKDYSWLCSASVEDTAVLEEIRIWQQETSDYDFIVHDLVEHGKNDREFYVVCGTAYYKAPEKEAAVMTLKDADCTRVCAVLGYVNQAIQVQGYSGAYERFVGEADACGGRVDRGASSGNRMYLLSEADTQDQADAVAARYAKKLEKKGKTVRLTMAGRQKLLAGTYVKLEGLDSIWNGDYRVEEAVHRYDEEGYETEVLLEGC